MRARHETANKIIKQFSALSEIFRHNLDVHSDFVYAAVVITQISIEMGEPLFQVGYENMAWVVECKFVGEIGLYKEQQ